MLFRSAAGASGAFIGASASNPATSAEGGSVVGLLSLPLPFPAFAPTLFKPLPLPFKSAELPLPITKYNRYKLYALLIINIVQAHICTMYILFV